MNNALAVRAGKLLARTKFKVKKYSPELLLGAGIVSGIAATVVACRGTLKINAVLAEHDETIERIKSYECDKKYTEQDKKKDTALTYMKTTAKVAKIYAPAITLGVVSITAILASYNVLHKRNVALAAAYATLDQSFKDYRNRVIDKIGAEAEEKIYYNLEDGEIEEKVTDEKTGKEKKVKKKVQLAKGDEPSPYGFYVTRSNPEFCDSEEYFNLVLRGKQNYYNDTLQTQEYLIVNKIREDWHIPECKPGMVDGWISTENNPTYIEMICKVVYLPDHTGQLDKCYLIDFKEVEKDIYSRLA